MLISFIVAYGVGHFYEAHLTWNKIEYEKLDFIEHLQLNRLMFGSGYMFKFSDSDFLIFPKQYHGDSEFSGSIYQINELVNDHDTYTLITGKSLARGDFRIVAT